MLATTVTVPQPGSYEVWVNFWCSISTNADWRIVAGLSTNQMQLYRRIGSQSVQPQRTETRPGAAKGSDGTNYVYEAYLGCVLISNDRRLRVYVDDNGIKTGTSGRLAGDTVRTWYEGVSYARVKKREQLTF